MKRKPQRNWTAQEVQVLERMIERGWQAPEIARWLKRSKQSVHGKVKLEGLKIKRGGKGKRPENVAKKCTRLEVAIKKLLDSMDQRTRDLCLGTSIKAVPGSERIYKTCSIQKLPPVVSFSVAA